MSSREPANSRASASSPHAVRCGCEQVYEPTSQPSSCSSPSCSQLMQRSSAACGPAAASSMPGHDIGSARPAKSVGTNTVAGTPSSRSTGQASSCVER